MDSEKGILLPAYFVCIFNKKINLLTPCPVATMTNKKTILTSLSIKAISLFILFMACLLLFVYIADESVLENENAFDLQIMKWVAAHSSVQLIRIMSVVTFFGSSTFLFVATALLAGYYFYTRHWHYGMVILIISISSTGIMFLLKQFFKRQRPLHPYGKSLANYSFPSGHSVSSFIFCSILAYLFWHTKASKAVRIAGACAFMFCSLLIGISRIVLNYHFATDVIAGFSFSLAWVLLCFWVMKRYITYNPRAGEL